MQILYLVKEKLWGEARTGVSTSPPVTLMWPGPGMLCLAHPPASSGAFSLKPRLSPLILSSGE